MRTIPIRIKLLTNNQMKKMQRQCSRSQLPKISGFWQNIFTLILMIFSTGEERHVIMQKLNLKKKTKLSLIF